MTAVLERPGDDSQDWDRADSLDSGAATGSNCAELGTCSPGSEAATPGRDIGDVDAATDGEAGLATAEYAIATIAAVGFGALLMAVLSSPSVQKLLENIFKAALTRAL